MTTIVNINKKIFRNRPFIIIIIIYIIIVLIKSALIKYYPSPQIINDETAYFKMAFSIMQGKLNEIDSGGQRPGYSLFLAPAFLLNNISSIYEACYFINIIFSSTIIFLVYYLAKCQFELKSSRAILISIIICVCPSIWTYNYTIMSENINTLLVFGCLVIGIKLIQKETVYYWVLLGVLIGFAPFLREQNTILFTVFIGLGVINLLIRKHRLIQSRIYLFALFSSIIVYCVFRYLVFFNLQTVTNNPEKSAYFNLVKVYWDSVRVAFTSANGFLMLVRVFFSEICYMFLYVGIIPIVALFEALISRVSPKQFSLKNTITQYNIAVFFVILLSINLLVNLGVTTIHAFSATLIVDEIATYGRYIDMFAPMFLFFGLIYIEKADTFHSSKRRLWLHLSVCVFIICFFWNISMKQANTLSLYGLFNANHLFFSIAVVITTISSALRFKYRNILIYTLVGSWSVFCLSTSLISQSGNSEHLKDVYTIPYYFKANSIQDSYIVMDRAMFQNPSDPRHDERIAVRDATNFWTLKFNKFSVDYIGKLQDSTFYLTNKILPREFLDYNGEFMMFDKENTDSVVIPLLPLYFSSQNAILQQEFLWMDGEYLRTEAHIPDALKYQLAIIENELWPADLAKTVTLRINGKEVGTITDYNGFSFTGFCMPDEIISEIEIISSVWDPQTGTYAEEGVKGLGLAISGIEFTYLERQ